MRWRIIIQVQDHYFPWMCASGLLIYLFVCHMSLLSMGNWCINVMSQSESRLESWVDMECACWGTWASGDCQCHVSHRIYHVAETRLLAWKQNMRCIWTARMLISGHVPSYHVHFRACPCMILVKPCSWLGVDLYWGWFDVPMRTCALNSAQALVSAACMLHEQHLRTMFRQHPMHCWKNVFFVLKYIFFLLCL